MYTLVYTVSCSDHPLRGDKRTATQEPVTREDGHHPRPLAVYRTGGTEHIGLWELCPLPATFW